ncbi:MAG: hypothetical protein EZS28_051930, partial [Streblomastix strix]
MITDSKMRQEVINHLKSLLCDSNNWVKENSKSALKQLSQNEANRSEILNEQELKRIEQDLKFSIEGSDEQKKSILQNQENKLLLLSSILEGQNDNQLLKRIISTGIVDNLLFIFINRDLNSITRIYSLTFFYLINLASDEVKHLIYIKNPYPGLIHLLEHSDIDIENDAITSILFLLQAGSDTTPDTEIHPHYESIQAFDGIKKLFALFQKDRSKFSRDRAALCIGFLFRSQQITDSIMRQQII